MFLCLILIHEAKAAVPFGYGTRTKNYSGWSPTVRGDINAVGMGGASIAVPTSISSSEANPAGFAMTLSSLTAQINKNTIHDEQFQKSGGDYESNEWGIAVNPPDWGFGITYYSPMTESGNYFSPNTGNLLQSEVSVKELKFTVAHTFLDNHLSFGFDLGLAKGIRKLGPYEDNSTRFITQIGALYRAPGHLLLGLSVSPQSTISGSDGAIVQNEVTDFFQPIVVPTVVGAGLGWIPNRFFKAGFDLRYVTGTSNTALLADQNKEIGQYATLQPRAGASYVIADYTNFNVEVAIGAYYEVSRIQGENNRLHRTLGLDVNPWFFNTGIGFDYAKGYRNTSISVGIDLVRTARAAEIIPDNPVKARNDILPSPVEVSSEGLGPGMKGKHEKGVNQPSVGEITEIIKKIPEKIKEKTEALTSPHQVKKKKKKKREQN